MTAPVTRTGLLAGLYKTFISIVFWKWHLFAWACIILTIVVSISICKPGFQGYIDDIHYLEAARAWLDQFPFLGTNHWHNRYPLVIPVSLSFAVFGESDFSFTLPSTVAYLVMICSVFALLRRLTDKVTAVAGACLASSLPLFVYYGGTPWPDIIEGALVALAVTVFLLSVLDQQKVEQFTIANKYFIFSLFGTGILLGLAFGTRQFAVAAVAMFVTLFLAGRIMSRSYYWVIGAGFFTIVLFEIFYYWTYSGDPIYRYTVDLHPDVSWQETAGFVRDRLVPGVKEKILESSPFFNFELISRQITNGLIQVHWTINPYLDFLTDFNYGFLWYFSIPASIWLLFSKDCPASARVSARLLAFLSALWFFVVVYFLSSRPHSRYFMPIAFMGVINLMLGLRYWVWPRKPYIAAIILILLIVSNWLFLDIKPVPRYVAHRFSDYVANATETVYASQEILRTAHFELRSQGLLSRVAPEPAAPGSLHFLKLDKGAPALDESVNVVYSFAAAREPLALLILESLSIAISDSLREKMMRPYPKMVVVREPKSTDASH